MTENQSLKVRIWSHNFRVFRTYPIESVDEAHDLVKNLEQPAAIHTVINQEGGVIWQLGQEEIEENKKLE